MIEGKDGWLYYGLDVAAKCVPNQTLDEVVGNVNRLRKAVEDSGRKFVLTVVPDKTTAMPENLPDQFAGRECAEQGDRAFWQRATRELGIVDLRPAIDVERARTDRQLWFPQDSHWTFSGGLLLTRALATAIVPEVDRSWKTTLGPQWTGDADLPKLLFKKGENRAMRYGLAPDGDRDRTNRDDSDFNETLHFNSDPVRGTVDNKVAMLADSFTIFACPYLSATFTDLSITHLETLGKNPEKVADTLTDSDTVVVEVVERHLLPGLSPITDPGTIDVISRAMADKPLNR
ncbi:alginate O-acetyltransferase AlgX-related protein [Actinokineospora sp. G85]|uniref:alginate O-acetyltransferase AlgX-related protein n=1 Tax=Actinokineospora sp. G85 TaxID=3406626 RepID=UPI003C73EB60